MQVVFVGGGSFRTLPIVRTAMADRAVLRHGTIWLVDFNLDRAETVCHLLMRTPEFAGRDCTVKWTARLDEALPGADAVCISFPVGSPLVCARSEQACHQHGFHGSDQLSLSGAFRSITGGGIILDIARRMEQHCPNAWLLTHANPVAVYSGLVNNHTRIKALGLCGACFHPRWDLTRLLHDTDEYRDDYTYASAGVNHLSFLLRCQHQGRDIYELLDEKYGDGPWRPRLATVQLTSRRVLYFSYRLLRQMRQRFGIMACSNELEGPQHLFPEAFPDPRRQKTLTVTEMKRLVARGAVARQVADREFKNHLQRDLDAGFWTQSCVENRNFGTNPSDPTAVVLRALDSDTPQWLAASRPNHGAVKGFKDRTVLEYSFTLGRNGLHPDADLEVPDCYHGVITALATHQTLLGDAIATRDPKLLADALFAYPHHQGVRNALSLWKTLLRIHAAEIPADFQKARTYFT